MIPRLKEAYSKEIQPALKESLGLKNIFMTPKISTLVRDFSLARRFPLKMIYGALDRSGSSKRRQGRSLDTCLERQRSADCRSDEVVHFEE